MDRWLRCRVQNGMFSDEKVVVVQIKGNGPGEYFVDAQFVQSEPQPAVKVKVVRRACGAWAELPTPYRETVPIEESELVT